MNKIAPATIGDNSEKTFNDFNAKFATIELSVRNAHERLTQYDQQLFAALGETLELGVLIAAKRKEDRDEDWDFLKGLLEHHSRKWSPKCEKNIFHELVSIGFDKLDEEDEPITTAPNMSKYRMILRYAQGKKWDSEKLQEELSKQTLTGVYKAAVSDFRRGPLDKFVENTQDRYERAEKSFAQRCGLPAGTWTNEMPRPKSSNAFASALLKLTDTGYEVVFVAEDEKSTEIEAKVASLVPETAVRSSKKLADQNLYWLFVACDFYRRFQQSPTKQKGFEKAEADAGIPSLGMDPSDAEIIEHLQSLIAYGEKRSAKSSKFAKKVATMTEQEWTKKFVLLNAILLSYKSGQWVVESRSTLAHAPSLRVVLGHEIPNLKTGKSHWIKDFEANAFALDFPSFENWKITAHDAGAQISAASLSSRPCLLADYSNLANWKSLDASMYSLCRFDVTVDILGHLARWRADEKAKGSFTRHAFQGKLRLEIQGATLVLVFPNDPNRSRNLGELISGPLPQNIEERFIEFSLVETMISWAKDYGSTFEIDLLAGHQGWTALEIKAIGHKMEVAVTVPLLLSHKGAPTEINLPPLPKPEPVDEKYPTTTTVEPAAGEGAQ